MTDKQIKQTKAALGAIRQHNKIINNILADLVQAVGKIRANYLSIDETINELEAKFIKK